MMMPLSENPAVIEPKKHLKPAERDLLASIDFFRQQRFVNGQLQLGKKRFSMSTIRKLEQKQLIRGKAPALTLTTGGSLALMALKGISTNERA